VCVCVCVAVHEVGQKFFGEIFLANTTYTPPSKYPDRVALDNVNRIILLLGIILLLLFNVRRRRYARARTSEIQPATLA